MSNMKSVLGLAAGIVLALTAVAMAGDAKFKTEGIIQRVSSDMILVRASAQDIQMTRDSKTKITGDLRRGAAATVIYTKVAGQNHAIEVIMGGNVNARQPL